MNPLELADDDLAALDDSALDLLSPVTLSESSRAKHGAAARPNRALIFDGERAPDAPNGLLDGSVMDLGEDFDLLK